MVVHLRVVDSIGTPVAGAEVTAIHALDVIGATVMTDQAGQQQLTVPRLGDDIELVVRKIGFLRGDHFFKADRDSLALVVHLRNTPHELPAVQVTAEQTATSERNFLSADDIAASDRPIHDALDAVMKLRPSMYDPPGQAMAPCGLYNLFVNGARIVLAPVDETLLARTRQAVHAGRFAAPKDYYLTRPPMYRGLALIPLNITSALASIHPEHIEEMKMVDCRDTQSTDVTSAQNGLFVVLKPGVAFQPGRGSFVVDDLSADAAVATEDLASLPPFRNRLLGVFDLSTGLPLQDAEVIHMPTGTYARTTPTGTVVLGYMPAGTSTIEVRRPGYEDVKLDVTISPADTMPITVVMIASPRQPQGDVYQNAKVH
jgi:hypothetical protein